VISESQQTEKQQPDESPTAAPSQDQTIASNASHKKRTFRSSVVNMLMLLFVLLLMIVGVVLLGHTVSLVAEKGFYHTKWDDTTFNGIKLHLKD